MANTFIIAVVEDRGIHGKYEVEWFHDLSISDVCSKIAELLADERYSANTFRICSTEIFHA